jgi:DNA modification methylase
MMDGQRAHAGFFDVPYNVSIRDVVGRDRIKYAEFAMGHGEMSAGEYQAFLRSLMQAAVAVSREDAVHFYCSGYHYLPELMLAGREVYAKLLTMAVWAKTNAGQGSPWRNQHEEVCIFRVGDVPHRDNIQRGKHGRSRSNLWTYPGMNQFGPERMENLHAHATPKPVRMVMDALQDCTRRGDVVLDSFCGAGATLMACERIGRVAVCLDIEPAFVDTAIRRWQRDTGKDAIHLATGVRFDEMAGQANLSGSRLNVRMTA